jgi:hypothetical protein
MVKLMTDEPHEVSRAELKALKAKFKKEKNPLWKLYYGSVLEGLKPSPWYHDDNTPSLYRDRMMAVTAVIVLAALKRHELINEGLHYLQDMRKRLPNTFETLPSIVKEWEATFSASIIDEQGTISLRLPEDTELELLITWVKDNLRDPQEGH